MIAKDDRDAKGRFTKGNPGGPGRPRRATEDAYLRVLSDACPPERWQRIVTKAVEDAEAGDVQARRWLGEYLMGRPDATSRSLTDIAIDELNGRDRLEAEAARRREGDLLFDLSSVF